MKNFEGLKAVEIENIFHDATGDETNNYETSSLDITWAFSKFSNRKADGWNGFMEKVHSNHTYHVSKVVPVPFINNQPSSYDTIFTALVEAAIQCQKQEKKICFVTFDQPLYYKKLVKSWLVLTRKWIFIICRQSK